MYAFPTSKMHPPLVTLPPYLLSQIALETVTSSFETTTLNNLSTICSLQLTCRVIRNKLSPTNNPELYASIWRIMFDSQSVERWIGASALTSSALASEFMSRIKALKEFKLILQDMDSENPMINIDSAILIKLFMMLRENEGKNLLRFQEFVDVSRFPSLLLSCSSRENSPVGDRCANPNLSLVVALIWLNARDILNDICFLNSTILDLLQSLVLGPNDRSGDESLSPCVDFSISQPIVVVDYFGLRCNFEFPAVIPFARLCVVDCYNAIKRQSGWTCKSVELSSARFDHEYRRYMRVAEPEVSASKSVPSGMDARILVGLWDGAWFMAARIYPTEKIDMCSRPMQCIIRAYAPLSAEEALPFVDEVNGDTGAGLAQAWFPKGVKFDESPTSLYVYDSEKARWSRYVPLTDIFDGIAFDTILIGSTEPSHGEKHGAFAFHGRVRHTDGHIALLRKPLGPGMQDNGTWVFHGKVHASLNFVGDWQVTSETMYLNASKGWFHLLKIE